LLFDRRGQGVSDGDPNSFGWKGERDIHAAVALLQRRSDVDPDRIGGVGLSSRIAPRSVFFVYGENGQTGAASSPSSTPPFDAGRSLPGANRAALEEEPEAVRNALCIFTVPLLGLAALHVPVPRE